MYLPIVLPAVTDDLEEEDEADDDDADDDKEEGTGAGDDALEGTLASYLGLIHNQGNTITSVRYPPRYHFIHKYTLIFPLSSILYTSR